VEVVTVAIAEVATMGDISPFVDLVLDHRVLLFEAGDPMRVHVEPIEDEL
jgi:hypothetical protein